MPFKISGDDVENSSLESLISTFRKLCDNKVLVEQLEKFKDERNFLSHTGITYCLDPEDELNHNAVAEIDSRLASMQTEATRLRSAIHEEGRPIQVHLWFDVIKREEVC